MHKLSAILLCSLFRNALKLQVPVGFLLYLRLSCIVQPRDNLAAHLLAGVRSATNADRTSACFCYVLCSLHSLYYIAVIDAALQQSIAVARCQVCCLKATFTGLHTASDIVRRASIT